MTEARPRRIRSRSRECQGSAPAEHVIDAMLETDAVNLARTVGARPGATRPDAVP